MRSVLSLSKRILLALLLILALTPCGFCQQDENGPAMKACSMGHGGHAPCCHRGKPMNAFCKAMDKAAVKLSADPGAAPALQKAPLIERVLLHREALRMIPLNRSDNSPPRGPLVLRI